MAAAPGVPPTAGPTPVPAGAPGPAAAPMAAVPPTAWQGPYLDATSGRYYYHNPWTRESSWAQAPAAAPLPAMPPAATYGMPPMPMGMPGMPPAGYPMMPLPYGYPYMAPGAMTAAYGGAYGAPMVGALPLPVGGGPSSGGASGGGNPERGGDGREECGDFKRGKCNRGDTCRYAHVKPSQECRNFKAGRCTHGETCKFLHAGDVAANCPSPEKLSNLPSTTARERSRSR